MIPDPQDTIVALSSAAGGGARAVVRLTGPDALLTSTHVFTGARGVSRARRCFEGSVRVTGVAGTVPADLYVWPAPRTYTGQDMVELHTLSCPPLVDQLVADLLAAGARAAQPGEFTLRAFLAGKLDLPRAEAVLGLIEAGDRHELKQALTQLAGGVTRPLEGLREDLLNLLADVEAGLDFAEEDIDPASQKELLDRLARGLAQVTLVRKQLDQRAVGARPFRVVFAGRPNAGKSSLFNALAGAPLALVSPVPGTTRDYLEFRLTIDGIVVELVDTAGWGAALDVIEEQAQSLGREQSNRADLVLLCLEPGQEVNDTERALLRASGFTPEGCPPGAEAPSRGPRIVPIATKCDLAEPPAGLLATSANEGDGIEALRQLLARRARGRSQPPLAPSLSRCRHHVEGCLGHLRQAHAAVLYEDPAEILALELRGALDQLGEMVGAVYTDDLLDRIFSRFCIGK
jgi:tRNA modification GTPase